MIPTVSLWFNLYYTNYARGSDALEAHTLLYKHNLFSKSRTFGHFNHFSSRHLIACKTTLKFTFLRF